MAKSEKKRRKVFGFHTAFNKASKVQAANAAAMAEYLKK